MVFPSDLGWMAVVMAGATVSQLTFGHPSAEAATRALDARGQIGNRVPLLGTSSAGRKVGGQHCLFQAVAHGVNKLDAALVRRLRAFASGKPDPLRDIPVDHGPLGNFRRCVLRQCRRIPYGSTVSYAALAAKAGFPRAARAVGNCMAANRTPLLVPCHRVVRADGRPGPYSAPGGVAMKCRLLALESQNWPRIP